MKKFIFIFMMLFSIGANAEVFYNPDGTKFSVIVVPDSISLNGKVTFFTFFGSTDANPKPIPMLSAYVCGEGLFKNQVLRLDLKSDLDNKIENDKFNMLPWKKITRHDLLDYIDKNVCGVKKYQKPFDLKNSQ